MTLYFFGHAERFPIEQALMSLFQDERPQYSDKPPGGDNELELHFSERDGMLFANAILRRAGQSVSGTCTLPQPASDPALVRARLRRRCLQTAFYHAAIQTLDREPPWGMLSGVRPVKLPVRALLEGKSPDEAREALIRDYHVSPLRATLAADCAQATLRVLHALAPQELSLYVGIPFCPTRCAYCSFISAAGNTHKLIPAYLLALHQEIEVAGAALHAAGRRVRTVYLGGGTPTSLSAAQLADLLAALATHFPLMEGHELTVEAGRPDTITREKLLVLRAAGVTRLSINPQSLSDEVLRSIGRDHSVADFHAAWSLARSLGFQCINADLIAGLPSDSTQGFCDSLAGTLALSPENITIHTLALKRGSRLLREGAALPSGESVAEMLAVAGTQLRAAGYTPYYLYRQKFISGGFENISWSKPSMDCTYNICMMEELHSVLSLGAGGISKLVDYEAGALSRHANPKYPHEYIRDIGGICQRKRDLFPITTTIY